MTTATVHSDSQYSKQVHCISNMQTPYTPGLNDSGCSWNYGQHPAPHPSTQNDQKQFKSNNHVKFHLTRFSHSPDIVSVQ